MNEPMNANNADLAEPNTLDKLTGTTAADRKAFIAQAQETLSEAVSSAIGAVKENPKAAAAIAAGATAAVAGAAYGATKLAKGNAAKRNTASKTPAGSKPSAKK